MATINAHELPRPVAPGEAAAPPPPAFVPPAPTAAPTPGLKLEPVGPRSNLPRFIVAMVAVVCVVVALGVGGLAAATGLSGGGSSSPAVAAVEDALGVPVGGGGGCLARELDGQGITESDVRNGSDPRGVSEAIVECVDLSGISATAAKNAATNGWDRGCVEDAYNDAAGRVWVSYLTALFTEDTGRATDLELQIYGHC